jgi:hypothetical protein
MQNKPARLLPSPAPRVVRSERLSTYFFDFVSVNLNQSTSTKPAPGRGLKQKITNCSP